MAVSAMGLLRCFWVVHGAGGYEREWRSKASPPDGTPSGVGPASPSRDGRETGGESLKDSPPRWPQRRALALKVPVGPFHATVAEELREVEGGEPTEGGSATAYAMATAGGRVGAYLGRRQ